MAASPFCQAEVAVFEDAGAQLDLFFLILKQLIAFIVDLAFAVPASPENGRW